MKNTGVRSGTGRSILVTVLWATIAAAAWGQEKKDELSIGVKSRFGWWETSRKQYDHMAGGGGYFNPDTIESERSDLGLSVGPELKYNYGGLFARGSYLWGSNGLSDGGNVDIRSFGADIGVAAGAGVFVGYRRLDVSFKGGAGAQIADHSISDAVLGLMLQADPRTPGFKWGIEMAFGIQGLISVWDDDAFEKKPAIWEAELTFGYRFKSIPLTANVGYGIWWYEKKAREYPYSPSIIIDKVVERWQDWAHGVILNVTYSF